MLETPGHTPESISVLVREHPGDTVPYGVLTGDALFIGDVGRPDLLASIGWSSQDLGRMLHASITRLMGLPDTVRVFPAHSAGSACGKNLSTERWSTIGAQRATNYACQPMDDEQFLAVVTADQPAAPAYFLHDAVLKRATTPSSTRPLPRSRSRSRRCWNVTAPAPSFSMPASPRSSRPGTWPARSTCPPTDASPAPRVR